MFRHVKPFLRYLWSKGRVSDSNGKVSMVEPREYQPDQFFFFFLTPSKTSSGLVTTPLFSLVQPLLDRFWGPCRSFELPVTFGRCPISTPTPLHCISSLTYCPCHRKNRPTGERFFSLLFINARKAPDKGPSLPSPSLLSPVLT